MILANAADFVCVCVCCLAVAVRVSSHVVCVFGSLFGWVQGLPEHDKEISYWVKVLRSAGARVPSPPSDPQII